MWYLRMQNMCQTKSPVLLFRYPPTPCIAVCAESVLCLYERFNLGMREQRFRRGSRAHCGCIAGVVQIGREQGVYANTALLIVLA